MNAAYGLIQRRTSTASLSEAKPLTIRRFARILIEEVAGERTAPSLSRLKALPPRSMVGQLTLDQHIGVRIPGGQPIENKDLTTLSPPLQNPDYDVNYDIGPSVRLHLSREWHCVR